MDALVQVGYEGDEKVLDWVLNLKYVLLPHCERCIESLNNIV